MRWIGLLLVVSVSLIAREVRVSGSTNVDLQKAADTLRPGDVLVIEAGTYRMENSLFVPSGVTVRGIPGKTILLKNAGVRTALAEDGDFGESALAVTEPGKFHSGMGITVLDDAQARGWDVSVTEVKGVQGPYLIIRPPTVRDYDLEKKHARITNTFPILVVMNAGERGAGRHHRGWEPCGE